MKPVDDWGQEEAVTAVVGLLFLSALATGARQWWATRGPAYLQEHHLLLPPGQGLIHLGRAGDLNGWSILALITATVALGVLTRLSAPAISRSIATSRGKAKPSRSRQSQHETTGQNPSQPTTTWGGRR